MLMGLNKAHREERMKRSLAATAGWIALAATSQSATAQPADYYAGKTLRVIVGLEPGGTVDTFARTFSGYLRKHIPGNPTIIVQNMPGAGGKTATNHVFERAAPDGRCCGRASTTVGAGPIFGRKCSPTRNGFSRKKGCRSTP